MAEFAERTWVDEISGPGLPRRDRRSCRYDAYIPDPLAGRQFVFEGAVAADVADAEVAVAGFNARAGALADTEALARILLRAEAVASSRIEGLEVGARRLLRAELARDSNGAIGDVAATEVLNNIDAMVLAVRSVAVGDPITVDVLLDVHRRLLAGTRLDDHGGKIRREQNWIGGSAYNPCSAVFVPPPPELVAGLLEDLAAFCCTDDLPAVAQAAIAHAQFETVHPFVDGNGRTGRALTHMVLRRRGIAARALPPVSLVLATWARSYADGLTAYRYNGPSDAPAAVAAINVWVGRFAAACSRAIEHAATFEQRAAQLEAGWRHRLGPVRANSSTDRLLRVLSGAPIITAAGAAALIDRTYKPAADAIERLVGAGILRQINAGHRNRAFEAAEVIDAFTALERQLASPEGDTRTSRPARTVPRSN